jgi:uncharacterized heparinase superfamily protein
MGVAARWLRTLRPLPPGQVAHRIRLALRRRLWEQLGARVDARYRARAARLGPPRLDHPGLRAVAAYRVPRVPHEARLAAARDALAGRFTFLGRTLELGRDVAWHRPDLDAGTRLWKTQLHELPCALDLAAAARATGDPAFRARLLELAASWEAASPIGCPGFAIDCWNARAVASRLANLALAAALLGLRGDEPEAAFLGPLLARHALFLGENLELDLRANHLLRDAVGLVYAGALFPALGDGLALLRAQVEEQVLADGAHVERAPLYQAIVLEDLLEARLLLGAAAPDWLRGAVLAMAGFLAAILHGDGDLPLFGDTWRGEVDVGHLLGAVRALPEAAAGLPAPRGAEGASGLVALRRGEVRALLRAGPHGPDYQLGHAHGDLLSFELSRGPARLVVDTGTLTYDAGPARAHLRSTAAHNTLELDGESQIEAWGSFRVGRRGRARCVASGEEGPWRFVWACHDAYAWLPGRPIHHRLLALSESAILVLDAVLGRGRHRVASALHLAPGLPPGCIEVAALRGEARRSAAPWHPRWGETLEALRLAAEEEAQLPWVGGWRLALGAPGRAGELASERHGAGVRVHYREAGLEIAWRCAPGAAGGIQLRCPGPPGSGT